MPVSAASIEGLWVCGRDALLLRRLEKMDPTAGGRAVYSAAISRLARLYLGAAEGRGQCDHVIELA